MSSDDRRTGHYTQLSITLGGVIAFVGSLTENGFLRPFVTAYLGIFGYSTEKSPLEYYGAVLALLLLAGIGFGLLFLSLFIDRDKRGAFEGTSTFIGMLGGILGLAFMFVSFMHWAMDGFDDRNASIFVTLIVVIVGIVLSIPAVIAAFLFLPLALTPVIAGVICLPRILIYYTTRHPLLTAWERGGGTSSRTPAGIADTLGNPAKDPLQALKLKRDLERLEREILEQQRALAAEREQLRSAILGDAERFETEKRISAILMNVDTINTEVEAYRKYVQQKGKGR